MLIIENFLLFAINYNISFIDKCGFTLSLMSDISSYADSTEFPLYGCTTWTLMKHTEKKLDVN